MNEIAKNKGGARPGAGRKIGSRSGRAIIEAESLCEKYPVMPLDYMLQVLNDDKQSKSRRDAMAKAAAPYIHARLAAVEVKDPEPRHSIDLTKLDDDELAYMERIVAKAQYELPPDMED